MPCLLRPILVSFCSFLLLAGVEAQSIREGLVAEWRFDEESGLTASDSTGSNDGTLENFVDDDSHWVEGRHGGAISFDGSNHVEVPHHDSIGAEVTGGLTVVAWFRSNVDLPADGAGNRMLEKGNNYFFLQGVRPGGMNFLVKNGGQNFTAGTGESVPAGTWTHIAGVFDGSTAKVYIDGELKGSVDVPGPIDDSGLPLRIGSDDSGSFFNGLMDEVLIWSRPLSAAEIRQVMDNNLDEPVSDSVEIVDQPVSSTVYQGATARLGVVADGPGELRYLWYRGEEALRSATEADLVIPFVTLEDAGEYRVRVQAGDTEITSQSVTLTVTPVEGLDTGRLAWWSFDETSGTSAADGSDNGLDGDVEGASWSEGRVGGGLSFGGTDQVVVAHDAAFDSLVDEAAFAFWIRLDAYGELESAGSYDRSTSYVMRKGDHFGIRIIDDPGTITRTLNVRAGNGNDPGTVNNKGWEANPPQGSVELDVWQHWTVVYRNGSILFHKDGFPVGDPVPGSLGAINESSLTLGNYDDIETVVRYLDGNLDDVSIWERPLGEAEILEIAGKDVTGAPRVEVQPLSRTRLEGTSVTFRIVATGMRPVSYQWYHDGVAIEGADSNRLSLSRLLPSHAGSYTIKVTNAIGESTSEAAELVVEELGAITSGLAVHYTFDSLDGDVLSDTGRHGLDGMLFNFDGDPLDAGMVGGALRFDGEDDYIEVAHHDLLSLGTEATVSVWLNPVLFSGGSDFDRVFRKDVNYDFVLINGGVARVHGVNKTPYSSPGDTVIAETWQHFAYVVRNGTIQWYRNGEPVGAPLNGRLGEANTFPLVLGNYQIEPEDGNWINRPYQGLMDDLGIWQRALSPGDLLSIYQNGLDGKALTEELEPITIRSIALEGGQLMLEFHSPFSSRDHRVQMKGELPDGEWTELDDVPEEQGGGSYQVRFAAPAGGNGFYRIISVAPPPLFHDDFESGGVPGWTHGGARDEWELGTPETGPSAAFSGTNVYGTDLDGNFEAHTSAWLRSPVIDLSRVSIATLSFAEYHSVDVDVNYHSVVVNILDEDDNFLLEVFREAGTVDNWILRTIRLAGDATGGRIRIEFHLETDDFSPLPGFYIDDVTVREN